MRAVKKKRSKRDEQKASKLDALHFYRVPTGRIVEKRHKSWGKRTEESRVEQLVDDG